MTDPTLRRLRRGRLVLVLLAVVAALLVLSRVVAGVYVDMLWYREVGFSGVFWKELLWVWGVRAVMAAVVGVLLFVNLRAVARSLGTLQIRRRFGNLEIAERLPSHYIAWAVGGLSALLGLWFGASVPEGVARSALLWIHGPAWGMADPFLGHDLSHYLFAVPVLRALVTFGLVVGFLLFTVTLAGYATTGTVQLGSRGLAITPVARKHLGVLVGAFILLLGARFALGRSLLLLDGTSDIPGLFGYADQVARLPILRALSVLAVASAIGVVVGAWRNQLVPFLAGAGALVLGGLLGGQLYPSLVQRFAVVPNELERETPFIQENIRFTRMGFGLDALDRSGLETQMDDDPDWGQVLDRFQGLPVWSSSALLNTFRERQARFRYYDFSEPQVDRYPTPEGPVPVAISVREVDPVGIEDANWQNLHLRERFIAGNGVVAVAANDRTTEWGPRPYLSGLSPVEMSPEAPEALTLDRSSVFFASRGQAYALINPTDTTFLAPDGAQGEAGVDFPAGIGMGSLLRKLAVAWSLREANFLFSDEVGSESRLVLHRSVVDRVERIAPFLRYPESPYPVVHDGRVVWVLEGYTATRYFPLSRPHDLEFRRPSAYVRNSVKVTVDAVTGAVAFYAMPVEDPVRDGWMAAFPGLFQPLSEMPETLRRHLRYPVALLNLQSRVLLQYHQGGAQTFFQQEEQWALSQELAQTTSPVPYRPEYGLLQLPGDEEPYFQISTVFVPAGRDNLTGLLTGRLDEDGGMVLRLLDFPMSQELRGPRQVEALVEQDPAISEQFTLWRTGGSSVWTGHLHVIPLGSRVLYMEPIFLAADANAIPELRRFVVSDGERVAMEETLAGAVAALAGSGLEDLGMVAAAAAVEGGAEAGAGSAAREALSILDRAEARLRDGDFAGFGAALDELRRALEALSGGGP